MAATTKTCQRLVASILAAASVVLASGAAQGASPGLPFTEDFSSTALRDTDETTATWNTQAGRLEMGTTFTLENLSSTPSFLGTDFDGASLATRSVVSADFDGDGDVDIAAGNQDQPNLVYFYNGGFADAGQQISNENNTTRGLAAGDVANDGDIDIVEVSFREPPRLYRNNGSGGLSASL